MSPSLLRAALVAAILLPALGARAQEIVETPSSEGDPAITEAPVVESTETAAVEAPVVEDVDPTIPLDAPHVPHRPPYALLERACAPGTYGCFLGLDDTWRAVDVEYDHMLDVPRHLGISAAEQIAFVGVGAIWYFAAIEDNKLDWDIESIRQRFSRESVRYDSNTFPMNFLLHPLSGGAYYGLPRANGLNLPQSFVYAAGACLLWEFGLEFNEKLSINDLIATPFAGVALGEFFSRFSRYLNSAPGGGNAWQRAFGYTLGVSQAFHDRVIDDRRGSPEGTVTDALGYDASIAHRFRIDVGAGVVRAEGERIGRYELRFVGELVAMPGYERPGDFGRFYWDANFSRMSLRGMGGAQGKGMEVFADTILVGYYRQAIQRTERGDVGWGLTFGTAVGYTYRTDTHGDYRDKLGITHLPGLALEVTALFGNVSLRARTRLHGDFGGVDASAFPAWQQANPDTRSKSVLDRYRYYYGWGYSTRTDVELEVPYVTLGASVFYGRYASDEGLDRDQEALDATGIDVPAHDSVLDVEAFVRVRPVPTCGVFIELGASRRERRSSVGGFTNDQRLERLMLRSGVVF